MLTMIPLLVDYSSPMVSSDQKSVLRHSHGLLDLFIYWNLQFLNNVIINKTKVLLLQPRVILVLLFPNFLIIWVSSLSILSVPDEGCSRKTSSAPLISTFLFVKMNSDTVAVSYKCMILFTYIHCLYCLMSNLKLHLSFFRVILPLKVTILR